MFDKTFVSTVENPRYPQTIHEHRAPTDESIKLYHELLEKARSEVLETLIQSLPNNELQYAVVHTQWDCAAWERRTKVCFTLNNKDYVIEVKQDDDPREVLVRNFAKILLEKIGAQLLKELR